MIFRLRLAFIFIHQLCIYMWDAINYRLFGLGSDIEEDHVTGKVAIVTGSNTGIGKQVAKDLADRGMTVILACRNLQAGQNALNEIKAAVQFARVELMELDLSDLTSVRKFANEFKSRYSELHLLVNNAGICSYKKEIQKTKHNFELHMGVNHLGHFLLTNLLIDQLKAGAPSRVVTVSSSAMMVSHLMLDDLMMENFERPTLFTGMTTLAYNNSKMANCLFAKELGKRLLGTGVTVYSVCPGIVKTEVFRDINDASHWFIKVLVNIGIAIGSIPLDKSSTAVLYCALSRKCEHETGKFYRFGHINRPGNRLLKVKDAEKLWSISEGLVNL